MYKRFFSILFILPLLVSCSKRLPLSSLSFGVRVGSTDLTTADTAIFNMTGNPDFITFYSGEPGTRYAYRSRVSAEGTPILQFTSARANGNQPNSLKLMISEDFAGIAAGDTATTLAAITKASWADITSRAKLSPGASTASGNIDLSDFARDGKPVFIAFKYTATKGTANSKWTITSLTFTNNLADSTSYTIANLGASTAAITNYGGTSYSPGWTAYTVANSYNWVITAGTSLVITGATTNTAATADAEAWAIMGPLDLRKVTPDAGVPIKMISESMDKFPYIYQYATPGSYSVTFVASNVNVNRGDSAVRTINLTVH